MKHNITGVKNNRKENNSKLGKEYTWRTEEHTRNNENEIKLTENKKHGTKKST